jgi:alanyl-tRNA synthetase
VTGRGAYSLINRRFQALEQTAAFLKISPYEVPTKVASLQQDLESVRNESARLRRRLAQEAFNTQLSEVQVVNGFNILAVNVPNADIEALRSLGDKFRDAFPLKGAAILASGQSIVSVITDDLAKLGVKAEDLIAAVGGRGGGRPKMAQGSLTHELESGKAMNLLGATLEAKVN